MGSFAQAQTILIDLNENAGSGGPGGFWNTYNTPGLINGSAVRDSQNILTPITLSLAAGSAITDNGNFGLPVFDPNRAGVEGLPAWATSTTDNSATGDNFFTSNTTSGIQDSFTLVFSNLTPGDVFSFDLLASRDNSNALGLFDYSLDGGATWTGFRVFNGDGTLALTNGWDTNTTARTGGQVFSLQTQGYQLHRYMSASDVTLTGSTLHVRTSDGNTTGTTFSAINAARLTVVPEPASATLLLAGVLGACARRRRS